MSKPCIFCEIVAKRAPASFLFEDADVAAFMDVQPVRPGTCLVIPKQHVDHFVDLDERIAQRIMTIGQRIGRRMREAFKPLRVGFVVHGFGVAHAHLIVVPQHHGDDITSQHYAHVENGHAVFDHTRIPMAERATLDRQAEMLKL